MTRPFFALSTVFFGILPIIEKSFSFCSCSAALGWKPLTFRVRFVLPFQKKEEGRCIKDKKSSASTDSFEKATIKHSSVRVERKVHRVLLRSKEKEAVTTFTTFASGSSLLYIDRLKKLVPSLAIFIYPLELEEVRTMKKNPHQILFFF